MKLKNNIFLYTHQHRATSFFTLQNETLDDSDADTDGAPNKEPSCFWTHSNGVWHPTACH